MGEEQTLCLKACEHFSQADFDSANSTLTELSELKKSDWRNALNKAIVTFCESRMANLDVFILELQKICDDLQIKLEIGTPSSTKQPQDGTTLCLYYNYALSLFLGCQFSVASSVIERLLPFCEPFDDSLSLKIALFAIHLHLIRGYFEKSVNLISQIESALPLDDAEFAWTRIKLSIYKAYSLLLAGNTKASKRELKQITSSLSSKHNQKNTAYIGYIIAWMKCHFEYLRGNGRKTLKLLNAVTSPLEKDELPFQDVVVAPGFDHNTSLFIARACGLYQTRRFNAAAAELLQAWDALDKYCEQAATDNGAISLRTLSFAGPAYSAVGYNTAVCFLHAGVYRAAFDAFLSTLANVKHMPQAWLHIAECCIQIHEESKPNPRSTTCRLSVVGNSFGNGLHRKIPVNGQFSKPKQQDGSEPRNHQQRPSLEFASACLSNCLMLIGQYRALAGSAAKASVSDDIPTRNQLPVGLPLSVVSHETLDALQAHALLSLAYVSLALNNFNMVIRAATDLLALGSILSPLVKYLGHLYMAEALVNVDRIADAVGYLQATNLAQDFSNSSQVAATSGRVSASSFGGTPRERSVDNDSTEATASPVSPSLASQFWPKSQAAGQAVLVYNLAVAYATRGDFDKAKMHLETAMASISEPWPTHFYHLAFYLALCDAPTAGASRALDMVRKYYTHVSPNR